MGRKKKKSDIKEFTVRIKCDDAGGLMDALDTASGEVAVSYETIDDMDIDDEYNVEETITIVRSA